MGGPPDDTFRRRSPRFVLRLSALACLVLALAPSARAQVPERAPAGSRPDSVRVWEQRPAPDTTRPVVADEDYGVALAPAAESELSTAIAFTSRDSLRIELAPRDSADRPDDRVSLFGEATAVYEASTLTAPILRYLAGPEEFRAESAAADSGRVGAPVFTREGEQPLTGRLVVYSLRTQRGRVTGVRTQQGDGYLLGDIVKQCGPGEVCASDAAYTTCDRPDHPHYALRAGRIKVDDEERVFTGPVRLELLGLPTPLWLPFGFFPASEGRRSGPLQVSYRQEQGFGLTLDNLGWYWAISDYLDAQVATQIGTLGSFRITGRTQYNRRYAYSGNLALSYGRLRVGERSDPGFAIRQPFSLNWSHNQTFANQSRLTSSVNLRTESQRLVATEIADQVSQTTTSRLGYTRSWPSVGRSLSVQASVNQNFSTDVTTATLPTVRFDQRRVFPFKRGRDDAWYEKISLSYSAVGDNAFAFRYAPVDSLRGVFPDSSVNVIEGLLSPSAFQRATGEGQRFAYDVTHTIPIQAAFRVPRFNLSLTPSLSFVERWAGAEQRLTFDPATNRVEPTEIAGFTSARQLAATLSASTELFGTFPIRVGALDGVRHVVRPTASLRYEPDYTAFGFVREVPRDTLGNVRRYAIINGIPTTTTRTVSFGVENEFLARTARADSTGEVQRTTNRVLSVSLSGGYNFGNDERPINDLQLSFNSEIYGFRVQGNASYSAYTQTAFGDAPTQTYYAATGRPLRLTRAGVQANRSFGRSRSGRRDLQPVVAPRVPGEIYDPSDPAVLNPVVGYVDYAAPLSFSLGASLNYTPGTDVSDGRTTATINMNSITFPLTPNWSFAGSTGLDLIAMEPTITKIALRRDLHCWQLSLDWSPIGAYKSYGVSLGVKSGYLSQFLRLDAPRSVRRSLPF